jgi:hypothetical protein
LPLIIFWNAATGHPQVSADFALAIASPPTKRFFRPLQNMSKRKKVHSINFVHTCVIAPDSARLRCSPVRDVSTKEQSMKHFMIKYQFANGTTEEWHREIGRFISALDNDPELKGKIIYRCMKNRDDSSYYHLAAAADEQAIKALQQRDFFKHYTEKTRQVAGGEVVVTPIELIAETAHRP